jgi:Ankyrin repeats (3 copies)
LKKLIVPLPVLLIAIPLAFEGCLSLGGRPYIFQLVMNGTPQDVQELIDQGADVNARDAENSTPLMSAAKYNDKSDVVAILLKAGARVNDENDYGWTALMYAAQFNYNPQVVEVLIKAGANVNVKNQQGETALAMATSVGVAEIVTELIQVSDPQQDPASYSLAQRFLQKVQELQQPAELVSTDQKVTLYVPGVRTALSAEASEKNKGLISLMESQVVHRPVLVSFACDRDRFDAFNNWMRNSYTWIPAKNMVEVYYRDSTEDNDYVIVVSLLPPGLNIYVMTYEYFMATH